MHKSLYEIQTDYAAITSMLLDNDGELTEEMELSLTISQEELKNKAEAYALRILDFEGQAALLAEEQKRLAARQKRYIATADKLKGLIKAAMIQFNTPKIVTTKVTLSLRKSEKVELPQGFADSLLAFAIIEPALNTKKIEATRADAAENNIDPPFMPTLELLQYLKVKVEADVSKIKTALKEGMSVGDCSLVDNQNLQIK